jgi:site-specific recombinase XerD
VPRRPPLTLADALEEWLRLRSAGRGLSANTIRAYRRDVASFAEQLLDRAPADGDGGQPAAARLSLDQLTPSAIVEALAKLQHAGAAPATRARVHGTLAALCAHLVRQGRLAADPMLAAALERPRQPRSLPRYIERDTEIARVLTAAATSDPAARTAWPERDLALAALLAGTGVRASELCGLRIRDLVLDVEDPYVRVVGKGAAVRDCPLPPELAATLVAYLASRQRHARRRARREDPVWLNSRGGPLTPAALDHHVRRWFSRAGVPLPPGAATHSFRHTVAMQLVGRGEAINVVQALLGHASLSSTQIYIRAAGHHVREAAHMLPVRQQLRQLAALPTAPTPGPGALDLTGEPR